MTLPSDQTSIEADTGAVRPSPSVSDVCEAAQACTNRQVSSGHVAGTLALSDDAARLDVPMIHRFLSDEAPWAKGIDEATVKRAIAGSWCFGAYLGGRQIAFARLVTDRATFGYLCDVFVLPGYRGRGYAAALLSYIVAQPEVTMMRRLILVTSDAHGLYRRFGFDALAAPDKYLECHRPTIYR